MNSNTLFDTAFLKEFYYFLMNTSTIPFLLVTFAAGYISYMILCKTKTSKIKIFKTLFYAPAGKSQNHAIQLGGLPLSIIILGSLFYFSSQKNDPRFFPPNILILSQAWAITSLIIVLYGYLDDKIEIRARYKLTAQFLVAIPFALKAAPILMPNFPIITFFILAGLGIGLMNGSNLLDGLDTLTFKLSTASYISYLLLGIFSQSYGLILSAALCMTIMASFYSFNKEPALIHLGEIGSSFVGFSYLLLGSLYFEKMSFVIGYRSSFAMALIPMSLPFVEILVSFFRRLVAGKSPFKGDRLHVHHIIRNFWEMTPSKASTVLGTLQFVTSLVGVIFAHYLYPPLAYGMMLTFQIGFYLYVGYQYWGKIDRKNTHILSTNSVKPDIFLLDIEYLSSLPDPYDSDLLPFKVSSEEEASEGRSIDLGNDEDDDISAA